VSVSTIDPHEQLVVPGTGEVVNLNDYRECALALDSVRDIESDLRAIKSELQRAIAAEATRQGTRTLELPDGRKAVLSGGTETGYDPEKLELGLREAGMPEERIREIVELTYTYKVKAVEAKRAAAANPEYAYVVDSCRTEIEAPVRVSIRKA
jgi:hypothetical protein